ncbi:Fe-Mn family superoxide dismutase [Streptomyces sp. NPDC050147]|uniref:Fe-Mn family superoxide dismutase n=1 Tax=Streptomyces sp. NPDC050147 TaxID=3155513 RepID=UPI0034457A3B
MGASASANEGSLHVPASGLGQATALFDSGWAWLVKKSDVSLDIVSTSDAATALTTDTTPLLVIDVWEHAYYIDYRILRAKYVDAFRHVMNWDFAAKNLG